MPDILHILPYLLAYFIGMLGTAFAFAALDFGTRDKWGRPDRGGLYTAAVGWPIGWLVFLITRMVVLGEKARHVE